MHPSVHIRVYTGRVSAGASLKALSAVALSVGLLLLQKNVAEVQTTSHGWEIAAISHLDEGTCVTTCGCYA